MNRKSKRKIDIAIPRETEEERERLLAGGPAVETGSSQIIRETTHVRFDGRVDHSTGVVNVANSRDPQDAPGPLLRPDLRREEDPEPVYDVLEEDEGGRALRESDDPLRQYLVSVPHMPCLYRPSPRCPVYPVPLRPPPIEPGSPLFAGSLRSLPALPSVSLTSAAIPYARFISDPASSPLPAPIPPHSRLPPAPRRIHESSPWLLCRESVGSGQQRSSKPGTPFLDSPPADDAMPAKAATKEVPVPRRKLPTATRVARIPDAATLLPCSGRRRAHAERLTAQYLYRNDACPATLPSPKPHHSRLPPAPRRTRLNFACLSLVTSPARSLRPFLPSPFSNFSPAPRPPHHAHI
ncbi:hypothetical protein B0H11DRAFT_2215082 [Mycena galericulata]|nr:hypothetical protein B0H11DRAFT_2215082 [Mycena galericulata]